jgi:hypothetical protein
MSNVSSVSSSSSSIPTSARKKPAQGLNSYTTSLASSETVDPDRVKAVLQERRVCSHVLHCFCRVSIM